MNNELIHPYLFPLLYKSLWVVGAGTLFIILMGLIRRTDTATYKNDWLRLYVMIGIGYILIICGAFGAWGLLLPAIVIAFLGWQELIRCIETKYGSVTLFRLYPILGTLSILGGLTSSSSDVFLGIGLAAWSAITIPMIITRRPVPMHAMLTVGLGTVLIGVPLTHLLLLVQLDYGAFAFLIILINCHDGFAVGFGRLLGKHLMCPHISPKKTYEGAIGAIAICLIVGYAVRFLIPSWELWQVLAGSILIGILALLGDLVASSLKREANIKDFSKTLPGMGGILDRFDGLLFIAPIFYAFVRFSLKV
ncbi:MAG: phosphatidate cytidylyltransferase [Candidatus Latescibacteria bacterium]|nr:phosphatidate cytidylyltransferase [Candidatus Latescibacterota bacterium]